MTDGFKKKISLKGKSAFQNCWNNIHFILRSFIKLKCSQATRAKFDTIFNLNYFDLEILSTHLLCPRNKLTNQYLPKKVLKIKNKF